MSSSGSSSCPSLPSFQRSLLALSLAAALFLLCALARRRLDSSRARTSVLVQILGNVSEGLDRLEAGLEDIAARTALAKTRLGQLAAARKNHAACALPRNSGERGTGLKRGVTRGLLPRRLNSTKTLSRVDKI